MKRMMESFSENPLGKTINRWVNSPSVPGGEPAPRGPFPESR
jgi:hypothetical protein